MTNMKADAGTITEAQGRSIRLAGYQVGHADKAREAATLTALEVIKKNGGFGMAVVRNQYEIGYMAGLMVKQGKKVPSASLLDEAAMMRGRPQPDAKTDKPKRTPEWQTAAEAARTSWSRLLKRAGVATTSLQGGARISKKLKVKGKLAAAKAAREEKKRQDPEKVPVATDVRSASRWLAQETAIINAFCVRNEKLLSEQVMKFCDDFRKELLDMLRKEIEHDAK